MPKGSMSKIMKDNAIIVDRLTFAQQISSNNIILYRGVTSFSFLHHIYQLEIFPRQKDIWTSL